MNKSDRLKALLERGYFPSELPPPFHTHDFAKYRQTISRVWKGLNQDYPNTAYEVYSDPRVRRIRRSLAIVNPIAQFHLSGLIADEWADISKHLKTSDYALEVPNINDNDYRAVPPPDFALVNLKRTEISAEFDHALVTDIYLRDPVYARDSLGTAR